MPILPYQARVFEELREHYLDFRDGPWRELALRPRWATLTVGPTGTGKTHLARALAEEFSVPLLVVSGANWVLMGCSDRAGEPTLRLVAQALLTDPKTILFIDEVDKLADNCPWTTYLRTEMFLLLDRRFPDGLKMDGNDNDGSDVFFRGQATKILANQTYILGAGAFQSLWEQRNTLSGFGRDNGSDPITVPSSAVLAQNLPRELVNRFGAIQALPRPSYEDYRQMIQTVAGTLPEELKETYLAIGLAGCREALENAWGARYVERVLVQVLRLKRQAQSPAEIGAA